MKLSPVKNFFLFKFLDGTNSRGRFKDTYGTKQIEVVTLANELEQIGSRWAEVVAVGGDVTDFVPGQYVLVDNMNWTTGFVWEGERLWRSDQEKVLAVSDEPVWRY